MLRLDWNLLYTIINLLILYFIVRKFLLKPVRKVINERQDEIDRQYADAKALQTAAEELKKKYEDTLSGIEEEKTGIMNEARSQASEEYERIIEEAKEQADKLVEDAEKDAEARQHKRMQQAQEQFVDLVAAATAKIVASKQNPEEDRVLYDQFLAKTGEKCEQ